MKFLLFFTIFLSVFNVNVAGAKSTFEAIPQQIECKSCDDELIANVTCSYKRLGWKKAKYNFDGYLTDGIQINNAIYKGTVYRLGTNLEYRVFGPRDYKIDLCAFLNGTLSDVIAVLVTAYIKRASKENNVLHPCPFSGHIYLRDFIFDEHSYSEAIFIPDGKYIIHGRVFTQYNNKSHLMAEAFTHVEIKSVEIH